MTFNPFFFIILIIAIIADFFFNTDATGVIALGAIPMTTDLSRFFPATATSPDFTAFPFDHDFVLDGKPQVFNREADGSLILSRGAEVITQYGIGYVERRHVTGSYVIRIVDFDETVEVPVYANPIKAGAFGVVERTISPAEHVARLANSYNTRILEKSEWFANYLGDKAYAEELLGLLIDDDCYEVSVGGDYAGASEFSFKRALDPNRGKRSSAETRAYRARIKAMADALLHDADEDEVMPEGMADELAEVFGS